MLKPATSIVPFFLPRHSDLLDIDILTLHGMFLPMAVPAKSSFHTMPGKLPSWPKHTMLTVPAQEATAKDISHETMSLLPHFLYHSLNPFLTLRLTIRKSAFIARVPRGKSITMSNPTQQNHEAARDRAWSTTATHGSGDQTRSDVRDINATETNWSSSGINAPFAIQRWLAEEPHEGPWNGMVASRRPGEQARSHN
jgi:hypothetical protein